MISIRLILGLMLPLLLGYSLLSILFRSKDDLFPFERLAYAWGLGAGALAVEMFLMTKLGIKYSILAIGLPNFIIIATTISYAVHKKTVFFDYKGLAAFIENALLKSPSGKRDFRFWAEKGLLAGISAKLFYVFFETLIKPVVGWDAFARWSFAAQIFYFEKGIPPFFLQISGASGHPNNLLSPLLQAWLYFAIGQWNEIASKIIFPIFFAALLIIFYFAARRISDRFGSILFAFFLSSLPFLTYHAAVEYSDMLVSFYAFAGASMLLLFFKKLEPRFLTASVLAFLLGYFSKNEGALYLLAAYIVLNFFVLVDKNATIKFGKRRLLTLVALSALAMTVLIAALVLLNDRSGSGIESGVGGGLFIERIPTIAVIFSTKMFLSGNWQLAWVAFIIALLAFILNGERRASSYLLGIALLDLSLLAVYYLTTTEGLYQHLLIGTVLCRNLLQFTPIILLFTALQLKMVLTEGENNKPDRSVVPRKVKSKPPLRP